MRYATRERSRLNNSRAAQDCAATTLTGGDLAVTGALDLIGNTVLTGTLGVGGNTLVILSLGWRLTHSSIALKLLLHETDYLAGTLGVAGNTLVRLFWCWVPYLVTARANTPCANGLPQPARSG